MTGRHGGETSRRSLLAAGASALATAASGCLSTLPPFGREVRYGRVEVPGSEDPVYRRVAPDPAVLTDDSTGESDENGEGDGGDGAGGADGAGDSDGDRYGLMFAAPGTLDDYVAGGFRLVESIQKTQLEYLGVGYRNYDWLVAAEPALLGVGSFDARTVASTLTESGYAARGTYGTFDLFGRTDRQRVVAVRPGTVVVGTGETARGDVETAIDARRGAVRRYHEASPVFERLSRAAGASPYTWIEDGSVLGSSVAPRMSATSLRSDAEAVYFVLHLLFSEPPSRSAIRRSLEDNQRALAAQQVDLSTDGRLATVEIRVPRRDYRDLADPTPPIPQVTWGVDETDRAVTVRHEAGDRVDATLLTLGWFGEDGWSRADRQFDERHETLAPGDELTVDLGGAPADRLAVRYSPPDSQSTSTLFDHEVSR